MEVGAAGGRGPAARRRVGEGYAGGNVSVTSQNLPMEDGTAVVLTGAPAPAIPSLVSRQYFMLVYYRNEKTILYNFKITFHWNNIKKKDVTKYTFT